MTYEEFLRARLRDLYRFAVVLSGSPAVGAGLVEQAAVRANDDLRDGDDNEVRFDAVRTWIVRAFLSEGMQLGHPVAADVDVPIRADGPADGRDHLTARYLESSKLQRSVLLLRYAEGLSDASIARTVGSTDEGISSDAHDEDELRRLITLSGADADLATGELWARISARLTTKARPQARPQARPEPSPPIVVAPRRRHRSLIVSTGVLALVVIVVAITLSATRRSDADRPAATPAASSPSHPAPSPPMLPGTTVLARYSGMGPTVVPAGEHRVPAGHDLAIAATCSGTGPVIIASVALPSCSAAATGAIDVSTAQSIRVTAPPSTHWAFRLIDQPRPDTNGSILALPNRVFDATASSGLVGSATGTGASTVDLEAGTAPPGAFHYLRIALTCTGRGVALSTLDRTVRHLYTRTCLPGWSYEFEVNGVPLPATLRVAAGTSTAWKIAVIVV